MQNFRLENMLFFMLVYSNSHKKQLWCHVFKLNADVVISDLEFDKNGIVLEKYDLQGIEIESITQAWKPYLALKNCDVEGRNCGAEGLIPNLMDIWSNQFNFSHRFRDDLTKNWTHTFHETG